MTKEAKTELDAAVVRRIFAFVRPHRKTALLAIVLTLVGALLQPQFGLLQRHAIDAYLVPISTGGAGDPRALLRGLALLAAGFVALRLFDFAVGYFATMSIGFLGQNVLRDIRGQVFGKLQRLQLAYFDQNPVGRLLTRVTSDVDAINNFITNGLVNLVQAIFLIVAYVAVMLSINWQLTLIVLAVLPLLFVATRFFQGKMREAFRRTRAEQSVVNTQLNENITGAMTVQMFGREARSALDFDHANRSLLAAHVNTVRWFSLFMPSVSLISYLAITLVVWYAAAKILGAQTGGPATALTIGTVYVFIQFTQQLFQPIQNLADVFNNLQAAMASSERIFEVLDEKEKIADKDGARPVENFRGHIRFENVWFSYDESVTKDTPEDDPRWMLRGVTLDIPAGQSVALVGATGAGKTSMTALISRFYDVQKGRVTLDGVDLRDLRQHELRRHVGVVLQDVFLFAGTVRSNLTLDNPNVTDADVERVCRTIGLHDQIMSLEGGYGAEVRERGAGFSTGEKQLLAFARALLQSDEIILVLDEATANIDTAAELRIQRALLHAMEGRTSVVIAHRLSTIERCDRIVVMRRGQIVEEGTHAELLALGGHYWRLQQTEGGLA